jgi:hypothetical protein
MQAAISYQRPHSSGWSGMSCMGSHMRPSDPGFCIDKRIGWAYYTDESYESTISESPIFMRCQVAAAIARAVR